MMVHDASSFRVCFFLVCVRVWKFETAMLVIWISWFRISEKPQEIETACGVWLVVEPLKSHPRSTQQSAIKRLSFTCTCGPEGMHYSQVVVRVCLAPLSPKIQDPPLMAARFILFLRWFHCLSTLEGVFFELPIRGPAPWDGYNKTLPNDQANMVNWSMISASISRKHSWNGQFQGTLIRRDFEVFFAVKHTSGISGGPVKVLQQSMTPKKGVYIMRTLLLINLHIWFWWLQISKTLASDFWGWTKL